MATYMYPNIPRLFEEGDQIVFSYSKGVPYELDIIRMGIGKCRIECFGGNSSIEEWTRSSVGYSGGIVDFVSLILKGVSRLYVIVGAGGETCSSDVRTYYDAKEGILGAKGKQSILISVEGNGGVPTYKGGAGPNKIVPFTEAVTGSVARFSRNTFVVMTVMYRSFTPSKYNIEIVTRKRKKNTIPLYKGKVPDELKSFTVQTEDEGELFALTEPEQTSPLTVNIRNPESNFLMVPENCSEDTINVAVSTNNNNVVISGTTRQYIGDLFQTPQGVQRIHIQNYYVRANSTAVYDDSASNMNGSWGEDHDRKRWSLNRLLQNGSAHVPWTSYRIDTFPGEILSSVWWLHNTYYWFDDQYHVQTNWIKSATMGRIHYCRGGHHGGGEVWHGYADYTYGKNINNQGSTGSYFAPYSFFNGNKTIFADEKTKQYTLSDGYMVWDLDRLDSGKSVKVELACPARNYKTEITMNRNQRIIRYNVRNGTYVFVGNRMAGCASAQYGFAGDVPIKITLKN